MMTNTNEFGSREPSLEQLQARVDWVKRNMPWWLRLTVTVLVTLASRTTKVRVNIVHREIHDIATTVNSLVDAEFAIAKTVLDLCERTSNADLARQLGVDLELIAMTTANNLDQGESP